MPANARGLEEGSVGNREINRHGDARIEQFPLKHPTRNRVLRSAISSSQGSLCHHLQTSVVGGHRLAFVVGDEIHKCCPDDHGVVGSPRLYEVREHLSDQQGRIRGLWGSAKER